MAAGTIPFDPMPPLRGIRVGTVMAGFSVASIVGVPLALEVAHWGGWRAPFLLYVLAFPPMLLVAGVVPAAASVRAAGGSKLPFMRWTSAMARPTAAAGTSSRKA